MPFYIISPKDSAALCVVPKNQTANSGTDVLLQASSQISSNLPKAWFINSLSSTSGTQVLYSKNQAYGLSLLNTTTRNCELGLAGPSNPNATIQFVSTGDGYYYIKRVNMNYYLSYSSLTSGTSLFWDASPTDANKKKWKLTSTTISSPTNYAFMTIPSDTCPLYIIRTPVTNIQLKNLRRTTLGGDGSIGINGGFFNFRKPSTMTEAAWDAVKYDVISIAKYNGAYVTPNGQENGGSGNFVIYRTSTGTFGTATGTKAASISQVANLTGTGSWAQGGAGMFLCDSSWQNKTSVNFTSPTSLHESLTAFVVDTQTGFVYLIVANKNVDNVQYSVNYVQFRSAIMSYLYLADGSTASTRFLGEFLDGGGSSQIRAYDPENVLKYIYPKVNLYDEPRILCEAIVLKNTN